MAVDEKQLTEDILRLAATDVRRCMQCGRCSANCEARLKWICAPPRSLGLKQRLCVRAAGG